MGLRQDKVLDHITAAHRKKWAIQFKKKISAKFKFGWEMAAHLASRMAEW